MPVHDWTRVIAGAFHSFHVSWIAEVKSALNAGLLPEGFYADAEQVTGKRKRRRNADVLTLREPATLFGPNSAGIGTLAVPQTRRQFRAVAVAAPLPKPRRLAIRHADGHHLVALLEIVSRSNKDRPRTVESFATKAVNALFAGVHVLVVDILPPGPHDPHGMHEAIWEEFDSDPYDLPADQPLTLASYAADPPHVTAYVEHLAFGATLPEMPLFLTPDYYVQVPLEATYAAAWRSTPRVWRDALEAPAA